MAQGSRFDTKETPEGRIQELLVQKFQSVRTKYQPAIELEQYDNHPKEEPGRDPDLLKRSPLRPAGSQ